ncbi:AAA family ATPase [Luteibacter aegosomatis]|uniref:AAA family ATPase n=1 Tax=Luteibacter aegosomatis TaxID=2911537 RepID=UPI001FFB4E1B|nr:AAA family ATPase [Luteibacter aegosomatis]UPG87309.1 AAA family ATPase [Luteibacter aegosomatis]
MKSIPRLESLVLYKVGVFDHLKLNFCPISSSEKDKDKAEIHILTGPNGCGKSTVLYAIAEFFGPLNAGVISPAQARFRDVNSRLEFSFSGNTYCELPSENGTPGLMGTGALTVQQLTFDLGEYRFSGYAQAGAARWAEGMHNNPDISASIHAYRAAISNVSYGIHAFQPVPFIAVAYAGQRNTADGSLASIQEIQNSPFENALGFDQAVRPHLLIQWIANKRTKAALAAQDNDFSAAADENRSVQRLERFIKDICDLDVSFQLKRNPLAVATSIDGKPIKFNLLPDGLKSIISWVADLLIRLEMMKWDGVGDALSRPVILLLDEIDIYLHPKWQRRILPALQLLLPNAQIFVSTHSPFVVGSVEDAYVYQLEQRPVLAQSAGAGKSYEAILEEVFDVEERFDVETEKLFASFYQARDKLLSDKVLNNTGAELALVEAAKMLLPRGEEVSAIVRREIKQVSRVLGKEIDLVSLHSD